MTSEAQSDHDSLITIAAAAARTGYTSDYLSRLCKSKKIVAEKTEQGWVINAASLDAFVAESNERKRRRALELSEMRRKEYERVLASKSLQRSSEWKPISIRSIDLPSDSGGSAPAILFEHEVDASQHAGIFAQLAAAFVPAAALCAALVLLFGASNFQAETPAAAGQTPRGMQAFEDIAVAWHHTVNRSFAWLMPRSERIETDTEIGVVPAGNAKQVRANWDIPEPVPPRYDGAVVVPRDQAVSVREQAEAIAQTFSDEVVIRASGDGTGIITPVFRTGTTGDYLYVMVPVATSSP